MLSLGTFWYEVRYISNPGTKTGFYWKIPGDYPANGPYPTEDAAKAAAVEQFEEIKRKVLSD